MANAFPTCRRCGCNRGRSYDSPPPTRQNYGVLNALTGEVAPNRYIPPSCPVYPTPHPDPFYRGPCPCVGPRPLPEDVYGYFVHTGDLTVGMTPVTTARISTEAGDYYRIDPGVPVLISSEGIQKTRGGIRITAPGIYDVGYHFQVPVATTLDTVMALSQDGVILPGTALQIVKTVTTLSQTFSANALIEVATSSDIQLLVADALTLRPDDSMIAVISMKIYKIA